MRRRDVRTEDNATSTTRSRHRAATDAGTVGWKAMIPRLARDQKETEQARDRGSLQDRRATGNEGVSAERTAMERAGPRDRKRVGKRLSERKGEVPGSCG